jgi:formate dehydrogenase major subunit
MLHVVIDGRPVTVPQGASLLAAVTSAGVTLPALCHDDRLAPIGACRGCLVDVEGLPRPVAACTAAAVDGMRVRTDTPTLAATRRTLLGLLVSTCREEEAPGVRNTPFERAVEEYLPDPPQRPRGGAQPDTSHPYIRVDLSRCIACFRCVRICHEVQGQDTWDTWHRGARTAVALDGPSLRESSCVSCGACVDTCPTGALLDATLLDTAPPTSWVRTVCPYCGTGCEITLGVSGDRIQTARPVVESPVSKGHLCVKGRYAHGFTHADDRLSQPLVRSHGGWQAVSWSHAVRDIASRLEGILAAHGPESIGMLGSARATNEDNYVIQKFARVVLGTNNVDCCARVCHAPSAAALGRMLGTGAATNTFDDIERARTILVVGANVTENHPVIGARIRQASRRGAHLVVIDPRRIELAEEAECHLAPLPGTNVPLLNALGHVILTEGLEDRDFIAARVDALEEYRAEVLPWTPERASAITGVPPAEIRRAARLYAAGPSLSVHGLGLTEHVRGTDAVMALVDLALITGNIGRPGAGVNPLRGQNNVQGAAHMGCEPAILTGGVPIEQGRAAFEAAWGTTLPVRPGLRLPDMLDAAVTGALRALWIVGYDVALTNPCASETSRALAALDLVVVQDLFLTETARAHAHVALPACASFEKDGTFMNAERRIQRVRRAVRPPRGARPDWMIVRDVARAMGHGAAFAYPTVETIWNEIRQVWPGGRGITYARLEHGGVCWPCWDETHPGTEVLHRDTFASARRARLVPVAYAPTPERQATDFPLVLMTGRTLHAFNAGTMTDRTPNHLLRPADLIDVSCADACRLGLDEGTPVRVTSRHGSVVLPVHVTDRVREGQVFATFHTRAAFVNRLTSPWRDEVTGTPEYKVTAVRLEPA